MKGFIKTGMLITLLLFYTEASAQKKESPTKPGEIKKTASLNLEEESKLNAMIAQHKRVRVRLRDDFQNDLDEFSLKVKQLLFEQVQEGSLMRKTERILNRFVENLSRDESMALGQYTLGEIAREMYEEPRSSELENINTLNLYLQKYLELQSQMMNENSQFSLISNVMKTKHDTMKNAINNFR